MLFINNYEVMINSQKQINKLECGDLDKILYDMKIVEMKMDIKESYLLN